MRYRAAKDEITDSVAGDYRFVGAVQGMGLQIVWQGITDSLLRRKG